MTTIIADDTLVQSFLDKFEVKAAFRLLLVWIYSALYLLPTTARPSPFHLLVPVGLLRLLFWIIDRGIVLNLLNDNFALVLRTLIKRIILLFKEFL